MGSIEVYEDRLFVCVLSLLLKYYSTFHTLFIWKNKLYKYNALAFGIGHAAGFMQRVSNFINYIIQIRLRQELDKLPKFQEESEEDKQLLTLILSYIDDNGLLAPDELFDIVKQVS